MQPSIHSAITTTTYHAFHDGVLSIVAAFLNDSLLCIVATSLLLVMMTICFYLSISAKINRVHLNLAARIDEYDNNVAGVEEKLFDYMRDIATVKQMLHDIARSTPVADKFRGVTHDRVVHGVDTDAVKGRNKWDPSVVEAGLLFILFLDRVFDPNSYSATEIYQHCDLPFRCIGKKNFRNYSAVAANRCIKYEQIGSEGLSSKLIDSIKKALSVYAGVIMKMKEENTRACNESDAFGQDSPMSSTDESEESDF